MKKYDNELTAWWLLPGTRSNAVGRDTRLALVAMVCTHL
jgi:hypothetical protein